MEQIYQNLSAHNKKYLHRFQQSLFLSHRATSALADLAQELYRSLRASLSQISFLFILP